MDVKCSNCRHMKAVVAKPRCGLVVYCEKLGTVEGFVIKCRFFEPKDRSK